MKKIIKKLTFLIACTSASAFILSSCTKNSYDKIAPFTMDPTFNIGVISGTVGFNNLNNILSDSNSYLKIGNDSSMTFYWNGNISTFHTIDFIPGFVSDPILFSLGTDNKTLLRNAITTGPVNVVESQLIKITPLKATSIDIDSIFLKSGVLMVSINNLFNDPATMIITVPGIKDSKGLPLTSTVNLKPNSVTIDSFDIANKWIDMSVGGTTTNSLIVTYNITLTKAKSVVEPNGDLQFTQEVKHPEMKLLYADIHQQKFFDSYVTPIPLNAFKIQQLFSNSIKFINDTININFSNSFGVPMSFKFSEIKGIDANKGNHYLNVDGIAPSPFPIPPCPGLNSVANTTLAITSQNPVANGNLLDVSGFLGTLPATIAPQFTVITNEGSNTKNYNFIKDTSSGKIDAQLVIPLNLTINNFITKDTFDFSFGDLNNIDSFTLRFSTNNGMPLGLSASLDFVDANYKVIDHINNVALIRPAQVDGNNKVIGKTLTVADIGLGKNIVPVLNKVSHIILIGTLSSPANGAKPALLYANQTMDVHIGAKAHLKIN